MGSNPTSALLFTRSNMTDYHFRLLCIYLGICTVVQLLRIIINWKYDIYHARRRLGETDTYFNPNVLINTAIIISIPFNLLLFPVVWPYMAYKHFRGLDKIHE